MGQSHLRVNVVVSLDLVQRIRFIPLTFYLKTTTTMTQLPLVIKDWNFLTMPVNGVVIIPVVGVQSHIQRDTRTTTEVETLALVGVNVYSDLVLRTLAILLTVYLAVTMSDAPFVNT